MRGRWPLRVRLQLGRHLEPGHVRHFDVGEHDVRIGLRGERQRFPAVMRARHDFNVGFDLEQRRQRAEDHALVLRDENANAHKGRLIISRVPRPVSRRSTPPSAWMRSLMPLRPLPNGASLPRPSSCTSISADPSCA